MVTKSSEASHLEIRVRDFGPIAEADFELRPMTVFVGPSNTGKSYLAMLVYALHRFFSYSLVGIAGYTSKRRWGIRSQRRPFFSVQNPDLFDLDVSDVTLEELIELNRRVDSELGTLDDDIGAYSTLVPGNVADLLRTLIDDGSRDLGDALVEEIDRCFGIGRRRRLTRHGGKGEATVLVRHFPEGGSEEVEPFEYELKLGDESSEFRCSLPSDVPLRLVLLDYRAFFPMSWPLGRSTDAEEQRWLARLMVGELIDHAVAYTVGPLHYVAHYLPADRTGAMHTHRIVVNSLIELASRRVVQGGEQSPILSGVYADFLNQLLGSEEWPNVRVPDHMNLAAQLERTLLKGAIQPKPTVVGYPEFHYLPEGWEEDIPMMNVSSMVSELAPVVLYMRYVVRPGDILIIEEPEAHLHPAMQVEFARQLAAAVRTGVRVMITTHSEWVLEELANLVHLSELPESQRPGIGGAEYALTPEQLGIWLFGHDSDIAGSVVDEIRFSAEDGGFVSDYEDVAISTHNDWARIVNRLSELHTE